MEDRRSATAATAATAALQIAQDCLLLRQTWPQCILGYAAMLLVRLTACCPGLAFVWQ